MCIKPAHVDSSFINLLLCSPHAEQASTERMCFFPNQRKNASSIYMIIGRYNFPSDRTIKGIHHPSESDLGFPLIGLVFSD